MNKLLKFDFLPYWKLFLFNLVAIFILVVLQHFGVKIFTGRAHSTVVSPSISSQETVLDKITPLLEKGTSDFKLKKQSSIVPLAQAATDYDQLAAFGVVDLDSGEVILEKNLSSKTPIASITKILSSVVSLDLASENEPFTVSRKASQIEPTKIGVVEGQTMKVSELINAAILTSANDAVEVLKDGIDQKYGEDAFILAMNKKAEFLGMKNSHFENPQGFDGKTQYSSVEDLSLLTKYALAHYPLLKEIAQKDYQFYPEDQNHKQFDLYNWNGLLGVYPGVMGFKIGNTEDAGYTTLVVSEREGRRLVAISLGAPGVKERDLWTAKLLDEGFGSFGISSANITETQLKEKYSTWKYWN